MNTLTSVGFYMTMPTLPKYALERGLSLTEAGVLTGVFSVVAIVARPVAGMLSDRTDRKKLLLGAAWLSALTTLGYSLAKGSAALFAFRIMHGACFAVTSTVQLALTSDILPEDRVGEGIGYMGLSQILAMSFAPNLGLYLADQLGFIGMLRISALLVGLGAAVGALIPYVFVPSASRRMQPLHLEDFFAPGLFLLAMMGGLFSLMNGVASSYLSMLCEERNVTGYALFFTVSSIAVLPVRPIAGRIIDRHGLTKVMLPSLLCAAAALWLISASWGMIPLMIAAVLKGAAQSSGQASAQAECAKRTEKNRRGVAMSTCYLGNDLGNSLGASIGGAVSSRYGFGTMFGVMGAVMLAGLGLLYIQHCMDQKRKKEIVHAAR